MVTENRRRRDLLLLANGIVLAIVLNQLASFYFFRIDLTEERRYSIQQPTLELLQNLDDDVYVEVYLDGELNAGFRRLRKAIEETLEEFRVYSHNKVRYSFLDPMAAAGQNAQREFMSSLASKGIQPMNVIDSKDGQRSEKIVFPGALISYGGEETGVMLLKGDRAQRLNPSIEGLEYEFAKAIQKLTAVSRKKVGFLRGHGELDDIRVASLFDKLQQSYDVRMVETGDVPTMSPSVLVIAKPTRFFSEQDKYVLDQYLLRGGRLLLLLDRLEANMDSVARDSYFAFPYKLNLEDQLFKYGVRLNLDLVQDRASVRYPIVTGSLDGKPQVTPIEWPFFPLINHYADHSITRNLDASVLKFASSIDTVKAAGIRKTPLLFTSPYARKVTAPVRISPNELRKEVNPENFSSGPIPLAFLLEGRFSSLYKNRFLPEGVDSSSFISDGVDSKVIIVGDGDLARNEINPRNGQPQSLGFDPFSGFTFANSDLLENIIAYLADDGGLINVRSKEIKVRPLDRQKIRDQKMMWQVINLLLPLVALSFLGVFVFWWRRKTYGYGSTPGSHA